METREMICIVCPMGCEMEVTVDGKNVIQVANNQCPRGEKYAREETSDPRRILTTTVRVAQSKAHRLLPVRTKEAIPKHLLADAMSFLSRLEVDTPVSRGQAVVRNLLGTGIDVIASRPID